MENLAEQLKRELTERAKESESCKKYLFDFVMNRFREGNNPVEIYGKSCMEISTLSWHPEHVELAERLGVDRKYRWIELKYENGKHYAKYTYGHPQEWVDVTDLAIAQMYYVDGKDESDKTLFLRDAGFSVTKTCVYGKGPLLEVRF